MTTTDIQVKTKGPALALWLRILLVCIAYIIFVGLFEFAGMELAGIHLSEMHKKQPISIQLQVLGSALAMIAALIVLFFFRRKVDRQSIQSMGFSFNHRMSDLIMGLIIAMVVIGGGTLILYWLHSVDFSIGTIELGPLILSFLLFVMVAFNEELLMRGYVLNNLMTGMNRYIALGISALIFSLFHGLNPNISALALLNIFLAGILLGSTYIFTQNLWFPISLHLFWNFFQGSVVGYPVSGQQIVSLFQIQLREKSALNGGDFGFEGSIVCTVLIILSIGLIFSYYRKAELRQPVTEE